MKEFDLQSIWTEASHDASAWYKRLRPELIEKARQQNNSVLYKLKRLAMIELVFGLVFTIIAGVYMWQLPYWLWAFAFLFLSSLVYLSYRQYVGFKNQITLVPTLDIITSTTAYLNIITNYRKRSTKLAILIAPITISLGLILGYTMSGNDKWHEVVLPDFLIAMIPILILLSVLTIYATKWYYRYFIGSKEATLRAVLESFEAEVV